MTAAKASTFWVDTHVHVFESRLPLALGRRYQPDYDATPQMLQLEMTKAGVGMAVLVQPSFLGTDNTYLLHAIATDPGTFAGIAVIEPDMPVGAMTILRQAGVVGVRLNCIGHPSPDFSRGAYREMAWRLAQAGLVLQIQAEGEQWLTIAPSLSELPCRVLIDHFGRTPPQDIPGGFEALLDAARISENIWFKFSGPYRFADGAAALCAKAILDTIGPSRVLWGSDWPWTQFEGHLKYGETLGWLKSWVPDESDRLRILAENPARLFGLTVLSNKMKGLQDEQ
jgi:predicted TIM-barrel fold metal-dependent hydrolase